MLDGTLVLSEEMQSWQKQTHHQPYSVKYLFKTTIVKHARLIEPQSRKQWHFVNHCKMAVNTRS